MGGGSSKPKNPPTPAPTATPVPGREESEAKKKAALRSKRGGRESTILAGKMNSEKSNNPYILNTKLG